MVGLAVVWALLLYLLEGLCFVGIARVAGLGLPKRWEPTLMALGPAGLFVVLFLIVRGYDEGGEA